MISLFRRVFLSAVLCSTALMMTAANAQPLEVSFGERSFVHRWSKDHQNEFTPEGQTDLAKWEEMVTLSVHPKVKDGDDLAQLANAILGNYQRAGKIVRTDSKPRTNDRAAEHFMAAILRGPGVIEAAFARLMLVDGEGLVVVYSRRAYGAGAAQTIGKWLQTHGEPTETALMGWTQFPRPAALKALPQSK
jgi:hypothetical protein